MEDFHTGAGGLSFLFFKKELDKLGSKSYISIYVELSR
jgi:hypothetical protein